MLQITADVFSGRPNPTWVVEGDEAADLLREIAQQRSAIAAVHEDQLGLGYRGLVVESLADNVTTKHDLPAAFRIGHTGHPKGLEIAERVLTSLWRPERPDESAHHVVMEELRRLRSLEDVTEADHSGPSPGLHAEVAAPVPHGEAAAPGGAVVAARPAAVTCWIEVGRFNPGFWNDPAHITRNNCYNYGSNRRTDTFAQPGRATGHQATLMACANVVAAALSDGLHHRFSCFPDSEKPRWLMALVVAPGYDYHWYRKQKEGFWGHKPGGTAARNTDNNGAIVWNPETAARHPYTHFCGYFYACKSQKIN